MENPLPSRIENRPVEHALFRQAHAMGLMDAPYRQHFRELYGRYEEGLGEKVREAQLKALEKKPVPGVDFTQSPWKELRDDASERYYMAYCRKLALATRYQQLHPDPDFNPEAPHYKENIGHLIGNSHVDLVTYDLRLAVKDLLRSKGLDDSDPKVASVMGRIIRPQSQVLSLSFPLPEEIFPGVDKHFFRAEPEAAKLMGVHHMSIGDVFALQDTQQHRGMARWADKERLKTLELPQESLTP